jgi:hypothetical protein
MTYNFDPEKWYENHRRALLARRERGELDESEFAEALDTGVRLVPGYRGQACIIAYRPSSRVASVVAVPGSGLHNCISTVIARRQRSRWGRTG